VPRHHPFSPHDTLTAAGAAGAALDALVAYTANPFDAGRLDPSALPLADEPHVEAWTDYARDAGREGVLPSLARRLVQLRFPIEAGISQTDVYRAATRRGAWPGPDMPALSLADPAGLSLALHQTPAGRIPVVTCRTRDDFVAMVRACSCRNEPDAVPSSMGACIVTGLNNWDRVARARRRLEADRGAPFDEAGWSDAFRALIPQKPLYQDRFILLSREPYSAVPAAAIGFDDEAWRTQSVSIRRDHECTHYFTLRAFGEMRNNLLDEFIADFAGLTGAFGRYDAPLFLRFLGLEAHPAYRPGGRFENYLLAPPLPAAAVPILRELVVRAARQVEEVAARANLASPGERARFVVALAGTTLVELASDEGAARLAGRVADVPPLPGLGPPALDEAAPIE
jgi:hypothetical protein